MLPTVMCYFCIRRTDEHFLDYHGPGDQVSNVNKTAMLTNTKAIAHAVAVYGESFETLNQGKKREVYKRSVGRTRVGGRWLL